MEDRLGDRTGPDSLALPAGDPDTAAGAARADVSVKGGDYALADCRTDRAGLRGRLDQAVVGLDPRIVRYHALMEMIKPLLAGHPPEVQGCVLADLLSLWLAGHPEETRATILERHLDAVQQLLEVNLRERRKRAH